MKFEDFEGEQIEIEEFERLWRCRVFQRLNMTEIKHPLTRCPSILPLFLKATKAPRSDAFVVL